MDHHLTVPIDVRDVARRALLAKPHDVPEVTYRLASGWALPSDRQAIGLWCLDNEDQFAENRCTLAAALRGGRVGMRWAMTAALTGIVDPLVVERQLAETERNDQMLTPQIAAVIAGAWDKMIDHTGRKARSRLARSSDGKRVDFVGWPNRQAALTSGVDYLLEGVWDATVVTLSALFAGYARTQAAIVAVADLSAAEHVRNQIDARVASIVNALIAFIDQRARQFITGEVPFRPSEFEIARTVTAWASGADGPPSGFTVEELINARFLTGATTAQAALIALLATRLSRSIMWVHNMYGVPLKPFEPHLELDGQTFTETEFAGLGLLPGDHPGCLCGTISVWTSS